MRKKYFIAVLAVIFCCAIYSPANASDSEIAKTYLRRAMASRDNPQILLRMINEAKEYAACFPEYEFLQLEKCHKVGDFYNAEMYVKNMLAKRNKAFLLDSYDIDLQAAQTYHHLHFYKEALPFYKSAVAVTGRRTKDNYLTYLSCLFSSGISASGILPVLREASALFSDSEIVFYQTLYSLKTATAYFGNSTDLIRQLENNGYLPQEIQYLKSFLVKNQNDLGKFVADLEQMQDISAKWGRNIVYGLMERFTITDENILRNCLSLWKKYDGNSDVRTFRFLTYSPLADWIKTNDEFASWAVYTGKRIVDVDDNGNAELAIKVKNGIVINRSEDKNQDGIVEREFVFHDNGRIDTIFTRENNKNFWRYNFNKYDSSLLTVENTRAGEIAEKYFVRKGAFVFNESQPLPILQDSLLDCREEYWNGQISKSKFADGRIVSQKKDRDSDGYFEYSAVFTNGTISEAFIDTDKNGVPDLHENYQNGKLVLCESGYSGTTGFYYYKEIFSDNKIEKYWDNSKDLKYEIYEKTLADGSMCSYFDINSDGIYDYMHEGIENGSYDVYTLNSDRTKKQKIKAAVNKKRVVKEKGWTVISSRNADLLPVPDEIYFFDTKSEKMNGTFSYKKQKFYFSDGLLKSKDFSFRLLRNGERLFLFDCEA